MGASRFLHAAAAAAAFVFFTASASASDTAPPDVVLLKNGGMVRGTIQELVPGQFVDLVLPDGSHRRYAAADIQYAGAAQRMPAASPLPTDVAPAPAPAPATAAGTNHLRLEANVPDVRLHERSGTVEATVYGSQGVAIALGATYTDLCTAPCTPALSPGQHSLALSIPGRRPIDVPPVVVPPGDAALRATYESRSGVRVAGAILWVGTLVGGIAVIAAGAVGTTHQECDAGIGGGAPFCLDKHEIDGTLVAVGVAVAVVGTIVGLVMMKVGDDASVSIAPVKLRPLPTGLGPKSEGADARSASGLGLTLAF